MFVQFVAKDLPAALGGLRVGDQILQIDGQNMAGFSDEKTMDILRKASPHRIVLVVRDRYFILFYFILIKEDFLNKKCFLNGLKIS